MTSVIKNRATLVTLALSSLCVIESQADTGSKPNIIYILADDLGYGELGCYGQKKIKTPNIDKLRAEGMMFTQHYSGAPVCAPSRSVLLTGKHLGHTFVRNNKELKQEGQTPIPSETYTIAEMLKEQGYTTACIGKWGLGFPGSEGDPNNQGFDLFMGYNCQRQAHHYYPKYLWRNDKKVEYPNNNHWEGDVYSEDAMFEELTSFVDQNKTNPFFLYWATPIPHVSLQVPKAALDEYKDKFKERPYKGASTERIIKSNYSAYSGHKTPRAAYAAMVTYLDTEVGKLMEQLDELGIADNTLVIFTSDNGPTYTGGADNAFFGSVKSLDGTPLRGTKGSTWEGGLRVPFIARWPRKITPNTTSDHVSAFWDMFPTFAEIAGAPAPQGLDGISMIPTLTSNGVQEEHDFLYWEFTGSKFKGQVAVRMGDWKGVRNNLLKNRNGKNSPIELYNLKKDIGEKNNVARQYPEIVDKISKIMKREHVNSATFPFKAIDK